MILPSQLRCKRMGPETMPMPAYGRHGDAGLDLAVSWIGRDLATLLRGAYRASIDWSIVELLPGTRARVPVGWAFEIPEGYEGQVRGRSGWTDRGLWVATGTVDSNYRGEVSVNVYATTGVSIRHGDRIAQMVIAPVLRVAPMMVDELSATERGANGFGSTGD